MADQLVSLQVTFCILSSMVSCSYGLLSSLLASTINTSLEDHHLTVANLSDVLELATSNASWTTAATNVTFYIDSTPNLATTAEMAPSDASWATAATDVTFSVDSTVSFSVTTEEQTASDTFWTTATSGTTNSAQNFEMATSDASWATAATDVMVSVDSTVPFSSTTVEQTASNTFWTTATEDTISSTQNVELTTSDASWATGATDVTVSVDSTVPFSFTTAEQTASNAFWTTATEDTINSTQDVGPWSAWSTCSSPCDGGLQSRVRVSEMAANAGVQEEIESGTDSSRLCNTNFCQVNFTEESDGVYIDLRTTLNTKQYVLVRDHIRAGIGREIVRFCNSSNNFATCCAGQTLRAPLAHSQSLRDSIVVKRAATVQNDSAVMSLFLAVTADAALAICQRPDISATTITHSAARRSAEKEQLYMAPTVLSRLLESGSLAQTINRTIQDRFPNVTIEIIAWRLGTSVAPLPEPCGALMEHSQEDEQCIYSMIFYVAIILPSAALVLVVMATLLAYKLRRRGLQLTNRGRGCSSGGSPGRTKNISKKLTNSICDSSGNVNDIYENASTFRSGNQARESAASTTTNDAPKPRPLPPPSLLPGCSAEDADGYLQACNRLTNSDDLQKTIDLPPAWQLPMRESVAVSGTLAARALGERLTQYECYYVVTEAAAQRPLAATPTAALPECGEDDYTVRMPEIDREYASIVDEGETVRNSFLPEDSIYECMG